MSSFIDVRVARLKRSASERYGIKPEQCHLGHLILEGLFDTPTKVCQIDAATDTQESSISLALRSMRLANALDRSGLRVGDIVLLVAKGEFDMAAAFYATHYMGYTLCSLDPGIDLEDLKRLYPTLKPKVVFTSTSFAEKNEEALVANNLSAQVVLFDDKQADIDNYIRKHNGTEIDFRPVSDLDTARTPAWLMLTSGTTGPPKAAIIPYDHVVNALLGWWVGIPSVSSNMILTSTQWLTSIIYTASAPIVSYCRIQSSKPMNIEILIHMIRTYRPEVTAWTPFLLARFVQGPRNICDLSCFRYILVGGGAMEKHIIEDFKKICPARLILGYGMTELLTRVFDFHEETCPVKSVGKPIKKFQMKLVDEHGKEVTELEGKGELWIKGYGFFTGYLGDEVETRRVLREDGWVLTGDIFSRDAEGYYYYVERKRLLIKYLGNFVSPIEVEEVIKRHPGVSEAVVVGVPDPNTMELVTAAIMKKPGHHLDPNEIFTLVNNSLSERKRLHGGLFFVDSFPMTVSAKVNRAKISQMAQTVDRIMPRK